MNGKVSALARRDERLQEIRGLRRARAPIGLCSQQVDRSTQWVSDGGRARSRPRVCCRLSKERTRGPAGVHGRIIEYRMRYRLVTFHSRAALAGRPQASQYFLTFARTAACSPRFPRLIFIYAAICVRQRYGNMLINTLLCWAFSISRAVSALSRAAIHHYTHNRGTLFQSRYSRKVHILRLRPQRSMRVDECIFFADIVPSRIMAAGIGAFF